MGEVIAVERPCIRCGEALGVMELTRDRNARMCATCTSEEISERYAAFRRRAIETLDPHKPTKPTLVRNDDGNSDQSGE